MENTGKGWRGHVLLHSGSFLCIVLGKRCSHVELKCFALSALRVRQQSSEGVTVDAGMGHGLGAQDAQIHRTAMPGFA